MNWSLAQIWPLPGVFSLAKFTPCSAKPLRCRWNSPVFARQNGSAVDLMRAGVRACEPLLARPCGRALSMAHSSCFASAPSSTMLFSSINIHAENPEEPKFETTKAPEWTTGERHNSSNTPLRDCRKHTELNNPRRSLKGLENEAKLSVFL